MENNPGISLFQAGSINLENQNHEEEEDLEEQKRRQEEIQSFLTKAMDEFKYDDQSTINSSTNVSLEDRNYEEKYKHASLDNQLQVLYEVRVEEVKNLTNRLNILEQENLQQKNKFEKQLILAKSEIDRANISLKQSQDLLVNKNEVIEKLEGELYNCKSKMEKMENSAKALEQEVNALKQVNNDISEQLTIMHSGFKNKISERQIQENHHREVTSLQNSLENALMNAKKKEKELIDAQNNFKEIINEKNDAISERNVIIDELTRNLDGAQDQCRELMHLIDEITQENRKLKIAVGDLDLAKSLQTGLSDKTEIIKVLQKELEKANQVQNKHLIEFENLQKAHTELVKNFESKMVEFERLQYENKLNSSNKEIMENNIKTQTEQIYILKEQLNKLSMVESEKQILQKRIESLQEIIRNYENKSFRENSVQVSQIISSFSEQNELEKLEKERLQTQLLEYENQIDILTEQLKAYEDEIEKLNTKISLEKERDDLIKNLQEKAQQFQEIILENQKKSSTTSVGTNTTLSENLEEFLKAKYETDLIESEIKIRTEIEEEFRTKFNNKVCINCKNLILKLNSIENELKSRLEEIEKLKIHPTSKNECYDCPKLQYGSETLKKKLEITSSQLEDMKKQQFEDSEILTKLLDNWKNKFIQLEKENNELNNKLQIMQNNCAELEKKVKISEMRDLKLNEALQSDAMKLLKEWNKHAAESIQTLAVSYTNRINDSKQKMDKLSKKTDKKIKEIEAKFDKKKQALTRSKEL